MISKKFAFVATTALVGSLMAASGAYAQSTGTTEVEQVVVTATKGQPNIDGVITAETAPKAKASIDQAFVSTQQTGQTIVQSLNLTPGLNFTNNDPYGSSGGNLRIRGFDGARISLTFDGIPLNDTGNYAIYTNQQLDPELVDRASVNMGTTDVDSPTASAVGGTINYISRKPANDFGGRVVGAVGSFNYRRIFGLVDTGEIGPWGTTMYVAGSYQKYDKFKGPGDLEKWQINGKLYQPVGDAGSFVSLAFHYNENRNNFYRTTTIDNFNFYGRDFDNLPTCTRDLPTAGVTDDDGASPAGTGGGAYLSASDNPANPSSCTNYYGLRINPSNTGNIREQSKWILTDRLTLTVDSAFQYTLANGGGSTTVNEAAAVGAYTVATGSVGGVACAGGGSGFDLNGDGDCKDFVRFYSPSNTNTRRYTVVSSLIWELNDNNTIRFNYTYDKGNHRQTGEYTYITDNGDPTNVFGGKDGNGRKVLNADGYFLRSRDRHSFAILNQPSIEYRGKFFDDTVGIVVGVRAPVFKRDLDQHCYTQNKSNTVLCTSQPVFHNVDTDSVTPGTQASTNLVSLTPGVAGSGTFYVVPYKAHVKYDDILPNVGVSWRFLPGQTVYASYAEGLSAPRTDQLYTAGVSTTVAGAPIQLSDVQPETSRAWDVGYRLKTGNVILSTALWKNTFQNRIVTSFDPDLGFSVDRNVGNVKMWGFDGQVGWTATENFTLYSSISYTHSEIQSDLLLRSTPTPTYLNLKGKALVETPEWQFAFRGQYDLTENLSVALQGKYVDSRYTTDINDEQTPAYKVFDMDVRYKLPFLSDKGAYLQLNVTNLFDEEYFSTISSGQNRNPIADVDPGPGVVAKTANTAFVGIGAPRTIQLTFSANF